MQALMNVAVALLNTDTVMALAVTAVVGFLVSRFAKDSRFKKFEPLLITAVKLAEQAVPDDTPNKGLARADAAMRYFVDQYAKVTGVTANKSVVEAAALALPRIHEMLEKDGTL